jgi:hypothetical protein
MKVLCFTTSYKRHKMLRGTIADIKNQSYKNLFHSINIAFDPGDNTDYSILYDDLENVKIVYNENKHQHFNHINSIISVDFNNYDLFVKIDDDDIYKKEYVKSKDLKLGATYKTKTNEEYIYMGRFDYHTVKSDGVYLPSNSACGGQRYKYIYTNINKGKHYFFIRNNESRQNKSYIHTLVIKSLGERFIETVSPECVEDYAELFEMLECEKEYSPYDLSKDEILNYTLADFSEYFYKQGWRSESIHYKDGDTIVKQEIAYDSDSQSYYVRKYSQSFSYRYEQVTIGTIQDVFEKYKPTYKNEYLQNGKLYRRLP